MACSTCLRIRAALVAAVRTVTGCVNNRGTAVLDSHRAAYVSNVTATTRMFFDGLVSKEHCDMVFRISADEYNHYFNEKLLDVLPEDVRAYNMKGYMK